MTGTEYRRLIAHYLLHAYDDRGVVVYEEVNLGTTMIGKQRRLDLLVVVPSTNRAIALECKFQDQSGTTDEKIPYALQDLAALRIPGVLVYAGQGFSPGVLHLLQGSELAAYCLPEREALCRRPRGKQDAIDSGTWQLDHVLATTFGWWDVIVAGKTPTTLE